GALAFSPDGQALIATTAEPDRKRFPMTTNNKVHVWNLAAENEPVEIVGHDGKIGWVAVGADSKTLMTVGEDKTVRVWDLATKDQRSKAMIHGQRWPNSAAFSPDGKTVATNDMFDSAIVFQDIETGEELRTIHVPKAKGGSVLAFSRDGRMLVSGSQALFNTSEEFDSSIHVWEVASCKEIRSYIPGSTTSLAFA